MKNNLFNKNLIIDIVLDFIWPTRCAACDKIIKKIEIKSGFCKECRAIICDTGDTVCLKCGKRIKNLDGEYCKECNSKTHYFTQAKSIFEYKGKMKESMYRFKYSNKREYGNAYAKEAVRRYKDWIANINPDVIIPVPLYAKKKRVRGYNQAEIFGKYLSRYIGVPCKGDWIERVRDTKPLKLLEAKERKINLKKAFKKTKKFRKVDDILLVDDIFTTGATVDEISKLLKVLGVKNIYCLFICIGKDDTF